MSVLGSPMNHKGVPYTSTMGYASPVSQSNPHRPTSQQAFHQSYYAAHGPDGHLNNGPIPMGTPVPMNYLEQEEMVRRMRDYEALTQIITQWNATRLDLFALSLPNEVRDHCN